MVSFTCEICLQMFALGAIAYFTVNRIVNRDRDEAYKQIAEDYVALKARREASASAPATSENWDVEVEVDVKAK